MTAFSDFNLHPRILKALDKAGYKEPTKIQEKAIHKIVKGHDIRASANTGTGKTAAFLLPILSRLTEPSSKPGKGPRMLILAPTRELAMQIAVQAEKYGKFLDRVRTVCICGGVSYFKQQRDLSRPYDILIATPGRLIDYLDRGKINLSRVEILVLDEADRMLDMGFLEPVETIVSATPEERQTLLFSATLKGSVLSLSNKLLKNPMDIIVHSEKEKHENIEQKLHYVDDLNHKNRLLDHLLEDESIKHAIVFTSTKRHAEKLVLELQEKGFSAAALHGDMHQGARTRTINALRHGKIKILVATDVAARGIDVQSITHVINFDLPRNAEDYVHRIGRTGRAGAFGTALSFASGQDYQQVQRIQSFTGHKMSVVEVEGMEPRRQPRKEGGSDFQSRNKRFGRGSRRDAPRGDRKWQDGPRTREKKYESSRDERSWQDSPKGHEKRQDSPRGDRSWQDSPRGHEKRQDSPRGDRSWQDSSRGREKRQETSRGDRNWHEMPRSREKKHENSGGDRSWQEMSEVREKRQESSRDNKGWQEGPKAREKKQNGPRGGRKWQDAPRGGKRGFVDSRKKRPQKNSNIRVLDLRK